MYIGIDVGGTFTDIALNRDDGSGLLLHKLPSTPEAPELAIIAGLRQILDANGLQAAAVRRLAHGTTVGTNALIQRRCGRVAIVTSQGFRDLIEIGRQTRPRVYDMHLDFPAPLVERHLRLEVPQRRLADGSVHVALDEEAVRRAGQALAAEDVDCVVVCFLHSYADPGDENRAAAILRDGLPARVRVLTSSSVYPEFREYERFSTAVLNAALITIITAYLERLTEGVAELGIVPEIKISQSSGGLMSVSMARELPVRASLSGPAAGVQGALRRATEAGFADIITLDVGGTSADVALLRGGRPVEVNERDLAGFPVRIPAMDVNAVGAGGGSIARIDRAGLLKVGPDSAGASPGPACYGLGGSEATVTDANVFLGRLNGEALLGGRMPIRRDLAAGCIEAIAARLGVSADAAALGIVDVACARMVKAIRAISVERGHDPRDFALFVYGGAGPLHASDVARDLGIRQIVVPPSPGILCAEGAMNAPLSVEYVRTLLAPLSAASIAALRATAAALSAEVGAWFAREGVAPAQRRTAWTIGARYVGQNYELTLPVDLDLADTALADDLAAKFHAAHATTYGFAAASEPIQIVNLAVKALGLLEVAALPGLPPGEQGLPREMREALFSGGTRVATPVFDRAALAPGHVVVGPAIVEQMDTTVLVFPGDRCAVDRWGNLVIELSGTVR